MSPTSSSLRDRWAQLRGSPIERDLSRFEVEVASILERSTALAAQSDEELRDGVLVLRRRAHAGEELSELRVPLYARLREIARRRLGLLAYPEQMLAAVALSGRRVVEMQTGEGKTLAGLFPAALRALRGEGVHVLTFNDYLAGRDAGWMAPVYRAAGFSVGVVQAEMSPAERRAGYAADVTYLTAKEAGFDLLRDQLVRDPTECVHRGLHFALIDEADSLLIDEARVPLVIASSVEGRAEHAARLAKLVAELDTDGDLLFDEYRRNVELSERGIDRMESMLESGSLHDEENHELLAELHCALHAHHLLRRDVDYVVRDGRVEVVDEFTGRVVADRHWPDGLQAALEAKEGVLARGEGRILGSMTLQHFVARYASLSGMTGTAASAADELSEIYDLATVVVPPHRPVIREDREDLVFTHREAKESAVVREVERVHATGQPILVGTLTIGESERLAAALRERGVDCVALNAKNDAEEASIVAEAGRLGAVTIATNMAGRGTDIRLGGESESERDEVARVGGLYVLGTNRHESRRVDLQLRGRAGRQGDPGVSRFYLSLEDELFERYGLRSLIPDRFAPPRQEERIDVPAVGREIARVQRIVEGQNLEIRRTLGRYAEPIERQRRDLQERRERVLRGEVLSGVWEGDAELYRKLVSGVGETVARQAERVATLHAIDEAWAAQLGFAAELREGIHLVGLGGDDPLTRFSVRTAEAYRELDETIDEQLLSVLRSIDLERATTEGIDLEALGLTAPASTWTYLVNDDPFRDQLAVQLTGPGRSTMAIGAAIMAWPMLLLWLVTHWAKRRRAQRPE